MNEFLKIINTFWGGATVFLASSGLVLFIFRESILSFIQNHFLKDLEKYKYDLNSLTEDMKFSYQKKLADFNFFIKKKHEVYPELFAKVMQATDLAKGIHGRIEIFNDFIGAGANEEDILEYMTLHQFPKGKKESIQQLWKSDKVAAQKEMHSLVKVFAHQKIRDQWIEADEYYRKSIIYLSDELKNSLEQLFDKIGRLNGYYAGIFSGRKETVEQVIKEMDVILEKVITIIRKELHEG